MTWVILFSCFYISLAVMGKFERRAQDIYPQISIVGRSSNGELGNVSGSAKLQCTTWGSLESIRETNHLDEPSPR